VPERYSARRGLAIRSAAGAAAAALTVALAGCAQFDASLSKQWMTVNFKPNTPVATLLKVRAACSRVPNVRPVALPRKRTTANMTDALTYITTNASDADLARLQVCLQKFPSVAGFTPGDAGDEGG
jgi:hypothetical protein